MAHNNERVNDKKSIEKQALFYVWQDCKCSFI